MVCLLLGVCISQMPTFNWSWNYCFLFGSILCATDPVSVVSLLKSTKASTKLTMIISGESLLNDGSAMILYIFFFNMINGTVYTAGSLVAFIAEMLILSPLIGVVIGFITGRLMRRLNRPTTSNLDFQLLFSFIAAYSSFYIAASISKVSGVLACASAGIMVSYIAPLVVVEDHNFHVVWEYAEWICNTLIFILAGFIGGSNTATAMTGSHFLYLFIMYIALLVARGVMAFIMLPMLNRAGEPCNVGETIFMTYAGLRGALSIALALEGANNATEKGNPDLGNQLFFMVTWLSAFTLLLNGSTAGQLLLYFKLIDDPNAPLSPMLNQVLTRIKLFMASLMKEEYNVLKKELGDFDDKELKQLCLLMQGQFDERHNSERHERNLSDDEFHDSVDEEGGNVAIAGFKKSLSCRISGSMMVDKDLIAYTRTTFLSVVRARYYDSLHHGKIGTSSSASKLLLHTVDMALDDVHSHLSDWEAIEETLKPNQLLVKSCQAIDDFFYLFGLYPGLVSTHDAYFERIAIYVVTNFIDAHDFAQGRISFFLGQPLLGAEYDIAQPEQTRVLLESQGSVEKAKLLLQSFKQSDLRNLYTHRAAQALVAKQAEILHNIVNEGILSEKNAATLFYTLEADKARIRRREKQNDA
jgi:NhaP-type Na+/H+ or K+/H+ antiporter